MCICFHSVVNLIWSFAGQSALLRFFFFFIIWVLRPFQEYCTYIEPIVHQRWAKTREKTSDHPQAELGFPTWPKRGSNHSSQKLMDWESTLLSTRLRGPTVKVMSSLSVYHFSWAGLVLSQPILSAHLPVTDNGSFWISGRGRGVQFR